MYPAIGILFIPIVAAITGYDCGGAALNITTLSLLDIGACEIEDIEPMTTETYIQLLQLSDFGQTEVTQCKIEVDRIIMHCGMHSHVSIVTNSKMKYIQGIGETACKRIHETGIVQIAGAIIDKVKQNETNRRSATLAGSVNIDGTCTGAQYSDDVGTWQNVVVQASITITLRTFEAPVKRSTEQIHLPSGTRCDVTTGHCLDQEEAENYWRPITKDYCNFKRYDILYEGLATKMTPKQNQSAPTIYTVTEKDTTFALTRTTEFNLCGYKILNTEHPKLFIMETRKGRTFQSRERIRVDNLDIFTYVNSKFIYVERHMKTQLTQLYWDVMEQKCVLEKQILKNALSLASIAPDEMAYRIMKAPGYMAVIAGEVIHLIQCVPIDCRIRKVEECYVEVPVTVRNASLFLLPRSRILTRKGTPRDCNDLLPTMYRIEGRWYRFVPTPIEAIPPPVIQPLTTPTWRYASPASLSTSGIYTSEDLDRLRDHIMFPIEKPAALHTLAYGVMGGNIPAGSISFTNLLDEKAIEAIAESAGKKLWRNFITFGSASAGILAVFIIIRAIKLIIDTLIHGYALHSIYGWSMHLLAAVWDSFTNLLLHLGNRRLETSRNTTAKEATEEDVETTATPPQDPRDELPNENVNVNSRRTYISLRDYLRENSRET